MAKSRTAQPQVNDGPGVALDLDTYREIQAELLELEQLGYVVQHPGGRWDLTVKGMEVTKLDPNGER